MHFQKFISNFLKDDTGAVLATLGIAIPVVLGMTALGADGSYYMMQKSNLQTAVDAATYAAAWEISQGSEDNMEFTALREAERNGFDPSLGDLQISTVTQADGQIAVQASLSQQAPLWFLNSIVDQPFTIRVEAESLVSNDYKGNYCILALDEDASGAFSAVGTVDVYAESCGLAVNSSSEEAIDLAGNIDLNFGTVSIAGDYQLKGGSGEFNYNSLYTHASRVADPYADLEVPETTPCSSSAVKKGNSISGSGKGILNPGVYCGGLSISGNNSIVLNPGVYILDGGGLTVRGGGTLTGEGVTIILTNTGAGSWGTIKISGNRTVNLSAPEEGYFAGVSIFVDRNAPDDSTTHSITGTSDILVDGVIYIPSQNLVFGGTSSSVAESFTGCTKLIGQTIGLHGTPMLGMNCTDSAVRNIGNRIVKLTG
jgi:Flp pilus assembly protein TadG